MPVALFLHHGLYILTHICTLQTDRITRCRSANQLPREPVSEFEKLKDYEDDYGNESDFITFRKGFQLGMQLAVAGLEKDRLEEIQAEE